MLVIVLSVSLIGLPLIVSSYRSYQKSAEALQEIQSLKIVAELANKISKERAPANNVMSSPQTDAQQHYEALKKYRAEVDVQIQSTIQVLEKTGQHDIAQGLRQNFLPALRNGRKAVDGYIAVPYAQREMRRMDDAIVAMFHAWDPCYEALQDIVRNAKSKDDALSNYYILILLLADLRDQAGRSASNIMAAVTFNARISDENLARSMQTQRQTQYLWQLVGVIQPDSAKNDQFKKLYQQVKDQFLNQGLPIVSSLMDDSLKGQPFSKNGPKLTRAMVGKFTTVVDLQNYILETSVSTAYAKQQNAQKEFIYAILMVLVSLLTVLLTMIYAKKWVFGPLILAREQLFNLAHAENKARTSEKKSKADASIFDAISRLQARLQQREALEFQLKHIAHSDSLTGVANRFALDEYIKLLEKQPSQFKNTCLMLIDIDNFKHVNDSLGHIVGDLVIQSVAESLKSCMRASDLLVRYGGDEFLVLIDDISLDTALRVAEKIRRTVLASELFQSEEFAQVNVSISAGVAVGAASWMALLARADEALFRAKAKGKNSVSS